jgi:hypothetical protein
VDETQLALQDKNVLADDCATDCAIDPSKTEAISII